MAGYLFATIGGLIAITLVAMIVFTAYVFLFNRNARRLAWLYSSRNILARRLTTVLTVIGLGLVVGVFVTALMFSNGLKQTLVDTGHDDNAIAVRAAANTETLSIIARDQAGIVTTQPEVALDQDGTPLAVAEVVVLVNIEKRTGAGLANIVIRGTPEKVMRLRDNIEVIEGRMFHPGRSELIAGKATAMNFKNCTVGDQLSFAGRLWTIVGVFDSDGSAFDSELWGPVEQVQQSFRRQIFSSVTARLRDPADFASFRDRLESDPRLTLTVKREKELYAEQSAMTSAFLGMMGGIISLVFSLGAIIGAAITMYGSVANRTVEIGTLRALGFSRLTVLGVFLAESIWIAIFGGIVGLGAASLLSFMTVSTTNWGTFSELSFSFALSPMIVLGAFVFSLVMGIVGGFFPAVRAARLKIVNALREE
jgi:ABC-type antimicrobial peptide transport system permease subunit